MCRITVLKFTDNYERKRGVLNPFLQVLSINGDTNRDGTGLTILKGPDSVVYKSADAANKFLWTEETFKYLSGWAGEDLFGHVRISTVGRNIQVDDNSHPFDVGNIIGMHNGHFSNYSAVKVSNNITGAEVDSHIFYIRLAQIAGDNELTPEIINKCLDEFSGNFALAMYDKRTRKIFLVTGANDLYHYILPWGHLINTSQQVTPELARAVFQVGVEYNTHLFLLEPTKLPAYKIYELTNDGPQTLIDASHGKEVATVVYTPARSVGVVSSSRMTVNFKNKMDVILKIRQLAEKYGMGVSGIIDLITSMSSFSKVTKPAYMNMEQMKEVEEFLAWLYPKPNLSEMGIKSLAWSEYMKIPGHNYNTAKAVVRDFEAPFFMNSIEVLRSLNV